MSVTIRPYHAATDRSGLIACLTALQEDEHRFAPEAVTTADMIDEFVWLVLDRANEPHPYHLLVAEQAGQVVALLSLQVTPRCEPDDPDPIAAEVHELCVLPDWRNRGIGTDLLHQARQLAQQAGASSLRVRVDARNQAALALYRRLHFDDRVITLHQQLTPVGDGHIQ